MGQRQKAKAAARVAAAANSRSPSPKLGSDGPEKFVVPELSVKDCLSVIPPHCFERSALRSFSYVAMDFASWALSTTQPLPKNLQPMAQSLSPHLYSFARFAGWQVYALGAGLVGTGLWIIAHECGHQAFSTSKTLNNAVGWVLHSALGVHITVGELATRGIMPPRATAHGTKHFGIFLWLGTLIWWSMQRGFAEMFRVYFVPYLWVNHWLILITFLQHTDPLLPHYRQSAFTFTRGALSTMDRNLLGGEGFIASITGWLGATYSRISETHVLHHVCSKSPLSCMGSLASFEGPLARAGYSHEGRPGTWGEVYRVWKECRFIEDEGDVVFYKNARGLAARQAVFANEGMSDSGVDVKEQSE
ncbi:Delta-12 fatty acid desaturase [Rhizoctonia solani]|uniref:Delta-12 fatty acid desaturase n=1 Tax=Rhizoctonia solani TaxID=456999 RepID=A0A8H7M3C9_9AGAM|nr:Delta-12 fatty acid desaturase [Rhizoctonia solani]